MSRIAIALLLLTACSEEPSGALRGRAPADALWVLTYNVNFERPSRRTVDAIARANADIVFLQETNERWEALIRRRLGARYPFIRMRHGQAEAGMAILSRYAFTERDFGTAPAGSFPAWSMSVTTPIGALDMLEVHLHPPLDEDGSLLVGFLTTGDARYRELVDHLESCDDAPDLVLGDFNEGSGDAIRHLTSLRYVDAQTTFPPEERTWSWPHWTGDLHGTPDHVFVGRTLRTAAVHVMQRGASDHRLLRVAVVPR
jgi:endonuclease/exonuclease/phosphatase (EEP) superfamily protein YafD